MKRKAIAALEVVSINGENETLGNAAPTYALVAILLPSSRDNRELK